MYSSGGAAWALPTATANAKNSPTTTRTISALPTEKWRVFTISAPPESGWRKRAALQVRLQDGGCPLLLGVEVGDLPRPDALDRHTGPRGERPEVEQRRRVGEQQ